MSQNYVRINHATIQDNFPVNLYCLEGDKGGNNFVLFEDCERLWASNLAHKVHECKDDLYIKNTDNPAYVGYLKLNFNKILEQKKDDTYLCSKTIHNVLERAVQNVFDEPKPKNIEKLVHMADISVDFIIDSSLEPYIVTLANPEFEQKYAHFANTFMLIVPFALFQGYHPKDAKDMGVGALLHDIGETQLPQNLFNLDRRYTSQERQYMQQHPFLGFHILQTSQVSVSPDCSFMIWQHHERWDGSGYPTKLRGKNIIEYARLLSIIDVFNAMTANKTYRKAYSPFDALKEMAMSPQFNRKEIQAFVRFLSKTKARRE